MVEEVRGSGTSRLDSWEVAGVGTARRGRKVPVVESSRGVKAPMSSAKS